ncbi:transcription factor RAX1-like [Panicum miliaceum]|uniref:Transcription factor RAX1-like n=1 Tax=Panicum miliaceum TaxID=4540 RepID=A0A3L6T1R1_PANMI|nr:transcription factor RAX1-like [Panicum miliaceum]
MGRSPYCDKAAVKRGPWSEEEDARLRSYIEQHGGAAGGWMALPRKAGLQRRGKSCRLRWLNYLRPGVRHGAFSPEEDHVICALHAAVGQQVVPHRRAPAAGKDRQTPSRTTGTRASGRRCSCSPAGMPIMSARHLRQ